MEGARRIGKSYIIEEFAKNEYKSYLLIDFSLIDESVKDIFKHNRNDLKNFFILLQTYFNVRLYERESVIIFDEVQCFPIAREFIKTLVKDGRYDYIETGSLLSIHQNVKDIVLPSEEEKIQMFPMDFEEFLWAIGENTTYTLINNFYEEKKPLGDAVHRKIMILFRQYLLIGGMPQAILKFIETNNFSEVDKVKKRILSLYREDAAKFAVGYEDKVRAVFDNIPGALSKKDKHIIFNEISDKGRFRTYESAFMWLSDAMIINNCYLSTDPNIGLALTKNESKVKCYMADTGLLVSMMLSDNQKTSNDLYKQILFDRLDINEGMLMENIVAQLLRTNGHSLFYYEKSNTTKDERMEIDFLITKGNPLKNKVFPIEVKSTGHYTTKSLIKFKNKFSSRVGDKIILHDKDLKIENDILYLPLYMAGLI